MIGTLFNVLAIIVGSLLGVILNRKIPKRMIPIVFQAQGLFTLTLGIVMAIKINEYLIVISSLVIGAIVGEAIAIDRYVEKWSEKLKQKTKFDNQHFTEGLVTAFLLFCMGSMTILGAIEEGLGHPPHLLITKTVMDGFTAIILASSLGIGVLFSIVPLFIFQAGITVLAIYSKTYLNDIVINEITALGGILLIGLGLQILDIKTIKVLNMIPSLIFVVILTYFFA